MLPIKKNPFTKAYFSESVKLTLVIVIGFCSMSAAFWIDAGGREV